MAARGPRRRATGTDAANAVITDAVKGNLDVVDLRSLELDEVPPRLNRAALARSLVLNDNAIPRLPAFVFNLPLVRLHARNNNITELPPNVAKLARLEELDLKGNRLATLPAALGTLASLLYLNLADNELVHVPRTLARLSNSLKVLNLGGNDGLELTADQVGYEPRALLHVLTSDAAQRRQEAVLRAVRGRSSSSDDDGDNDDGDYVVMRMAGGSDADGLGIGTSLGAAARRQFQQDIGTSGRPLPPTPPSVSDLLTAGGRSSLRPAGPLGDDFPLPSAFVIGEDSSDSCVCSSASSASSGDGDGDGDGGNARYLPPPFRPQAAPRPNRQQRRDIPPELPLLGLGVLGEAAGDRMLANGVGKGRPGRKPGRRRHLPKVGTSSSSSSASSTSAAFSGSFESPSPRSSPTPPSRRWRDDLAERPPALNPAHVGRVGARPSAPDMTASTSSSSRPTSPTAMRLEVTRRLALLAADRQAGRSPQHSPTSPPGYDEVVEPMDRKPGDRNRPPRGRRRRQAARDGERGHGVAAAGSGGDVPRRRLPGLDNLAPLEINWEPSQGPRSLLAPPDPAGMWDVTPPSSHASSRSSLGSRGGRDGSTGGRLGTAPTATATATATSSSPSTWVGSEGGGRGDGTLWVNKMAPRMIANPEVIELESAVIEAVCEMGYQRSLVLDVAYSLEREGRGRGSLNTLLDALERRQLLLSDRDLCKVCLDAEINTCTLPCGHLALCTGCAARGITRCVVCRAPVAEIIRTYST